MGLNSWHDDSSTIENAMLFNKSFGKLLGRESSSKSGQTWWCQDFNNNKWSSHQKNILGQSRLVQHICRTCWRIDKNSCNTQKILLRVHTNFDKVIKKRSPGEITKVELNFKGWQIIIFKILNFAFMIKILIKKHNEIVRSGRYNFKGFRFPLKPNLKIDFVRFMLHDYEDASICDFLEFPFGLFR